MTDEDFQNQSDRLNEAEGQIFALTRLVTEILPIVVDPEALNIRLKQMQAVCVVRDDADREWAKFIHAAHELLARMIQGEPPSRPGYPSRPTLRLVKSDTE